MGGLQLNNDLLCSQSNQIIIISKQNELSITDLPQPLPCGGILVQTPFDLFYLGGCYIPSAPLRQILSTFDLVHSKDLQTLSQNKTYSKQQNPNYSKHCYKLNQNVPEDIIFKQFDLVNGELTQKDFEINFAFSFYVQIKNHFVVVFSTFGYVFDLLNNRVVRIKEWKRKFDGVVFQFQKIDNMLVGVETDVNIRLAEEIVKELE
ncbi:Hypothetical_protein [Hexamita inflata]|uniref:Hypothetical_protein n=1 Tax=Hexamita inflata TaxID=28002 RepID=A0ABP1H9J4_9EUKA